MQVNSSYSPNFYANFNSPKLRFSQKDFFVKIRGYGRNVLWAKSVTDTADTAVNLIRKEASAENVLKFIATGIKKANKFTLDLNKRKYTGILRTHRDGWLSNEEGYTLWTSYKNNRYNVYEEKLDEVSYFPLKKSYKLKNQYSRPVFNHNAIRHAGCEYVNESLNRVFDKCNEIFPKYIKQDIKEENLEEVNSNIAEIRWVLAHATPWLRGSDAISNVFIRAIYKAIGVKCYPLAKGVSLDLEAYCSELEDYKKNFTTYFEKTPEIIE